MIRFVHVINSNEIVSLPTNKLRLYLRNVASSLTYAKQFGEIVLYTDKEGIKYFSDFEYDDIYIINGGCMSYELYAYSKENINSIFIDIDTMLKSDIAIKNCLNSTSDIFVQNIDNNLTQDMINIPCFSSKTCNIGILKFNNETTKLSFINKYINSDLFCCNNTKIIIKHILYTTFNNIATLFHDNTDDIDIQNKEYLNNNIGYERFENATLSGTIQTIIKNNLSIINRKLYEQINNKTNVSYPNVLPSVAICAICKCENVYLREWVEYHKSIGVKKIILWDNNDINGEHPEFVLNDFIDAGFVEVKNVRGKKGNIVYEEDGCGCSIQIDVYNETYKKYQNIFDAITFIDIDEFIHIGDWNNIGEFVYEGFLQGYNHIILPEQIYDDNNIIFNPTHNVLNTFTEKLQMQSMQSKSIIKTGLNILLNSAHGITSKGINYDSSIQSLKTCNSIFEPVSLDYDTLMTTMYYVYITNDSECRVNHYRFKSLSEFIDFKLQRRFPDDFEKSSKYIDILSIGGFFNYNRTTLEKEIFLYNYSKSLYENKTNSTNDITDEVGVVICAMCKNENRYLREWVEYHKNIGVSKIILCDNNNADGENPYDVIKDYCDTNFVEIKNYRGIIASAYNSKIHKNATLVTDIYNDIYNEFDDNKHAIAFIDIDEFIYIGDYCNISDFVNTAIHLGFNHIMLEQQEYNDNNVIYNETHNVINTFTNKAKNNITFKKSIFQTGNNGLIINTRFGVDESGYGFLQSYSVLNTCDNKFNKIYSMRNEVLYEEHDLSDTLPRINHYRYKSISEYLEGKYQTGWPDNNRRLYGRELLSINSFFINNEFSIDKKQVIDEFIKTHHELVLKMES